MPKSTKLGYEVKTDWKGLDDLWKRLQDLNQKEIEYGFINEDKYPVGDKRGGMYVADIAWKQEQGFETTGQPAPPRPFFTQSIADAKSYVRGVAPMIFKLSFIGKVEKEMLNIGRNLVQTVKTSIDDAQFPLNTERTLDLKAPETRVLHETGLMYDSINARIVNRDAYGQRKKEVDIK
jgi:hypothetical protein